MSDDRSDSGLRVSREFVGVECNVCCGIHSADKKNNMEGAPAERGGGLCGEGPDVGWQIFLTFEL